VLEKATWVLAIAILALCLATSAFYTDPQSNQFSSPNIDNAKQQIVAPAFGETESVLPTTPEETAPDSTSNN